MSDRIIIELDAEGVLLQRIDEAIRRLERPDDLLGRIGAVLEANVQGRFDSKHDPDGAAWAPLAASTRASYEKKYGGNVPGTLLDRTGQMRDSLGVNVGDDYVEVFMTRLTPGGEWDVPALHEFGTARMPRRGLLIADPEAGRLGAQDRADIEAEIDAFLDELLG